VLACSAPPATVLAGFFGVAPRTADNWIVAHPDFADAVCRGHAAAEAVIVRALFERAKGFNHEVTRPRSTEARSQDHQHGVLPARHPVLHALPTQRPVRAWQARAEASLEPEIVDDRAARPDAAGESVRRAAE
jgi:hypothetical protein